MILGYELPVEMPTMDIYSTDLMKAYIAGVKEQYDNAREDYKDFMKTYGDFYSPIAGDTEAYYNLTVGGALNLLDLMYGQGIDPLRNPEARAMISRYIASVPTGKLQAIKQNAENYKTYLLNLAKMDAEGLYNKQLEDIKLKELGLDNFNTVGPNGAINNWTRLSPTVNKTLLQLTSELYDKFAPIEDITEEYKKAGNPVERFTKIKGVSDKNKAYATEQAFNSLKNGPYWGLYKQQAEDQVSRELQARGILVSPDDMNKLVELQVKENIIEANSKYLQPTTVEDKVGLTVWEKAQDRQLKMWEVAQNRLLKEWEKDQDLKIAQMKLDRDNDGLLTSPVSFTELAIGAATKKSDERLKSSSLFISSTFLSIASKLRPKQKVVLGSQTYTKEQLTTIGNWYKKHGSFATDEDREAAKKLGILDKNLNPSNKFQNRYFAALQMSGANLNPIKNSKGVFDHYEFTRPLSSARAANQQYYSLFVTPFIGGKQNLAGMKAFTGSNGPVEYKTTGNPDKVWKMELGKGGWSLAQIRMAVVSGYKGSYRVRQLQDFLQRNNIVATANSSSAMNNYAAVPTTNGKSSVDLTATMQVPLSELKPFFEKIGITDKSKQMEFLQREGFTLSNTQGKEIGNSTSGDNYDVSKNKQYWNSFLYVNLPITKTVNNQQYEFANLNNIFDKEQFTPTNADSYTQDRQLESVWRSISGSTR